MIQAQCVITRRLIHYKSPRETVRDYEKRMTAMFLSSCSAEKAYEWLSENSMRFADEGVFHQRTLIRERRVLEYLLLRRKDRLIDLGLAQFGGTPYALQAVFVRGTAGIRCALLANPSLSAQDLQGKNPVVNLSAIAKRGDRRELEALALNPHFPNTFYEHLLNRTEYFAELDESNYKFMLSRLGENPRLSTPYDYTHLNGFTQWDHDRTSTMAWALTKTVPTTEEWAEVLVRLLHKAEGGLEEEEIAPTLERWRIDPPLTDDDREYMLGYSYSWQLRFRLADLLKANNNLLNSEDPALRGSFYRRFSLREYRNWPEFLQKDGEGFVKEAMHNMSLWQTKEDRKRLKQVAWDTPDPNSDLSMPNVYMSLFKMRLAEHPDWFYDETDEHSADPNAVARRTEKLLNSIVERLDILSIEREKPKA